MDNDFDSAQPPTSNTKQETQNNRLWIMTSTPLSRQHQTLNIKQQIMDNGFGFAQPPTSNTKQETTNNRLWTTASTSLSRQHQLDTTASAPLSRQHHPLNKKHKTTDYGQRLRLRSAANIKP